MLGLFAAGFAARLGPQAVWNIGADADARRLAISLQQARRLAIKTGDNHYVLLSPNASAAASFRVYHWNGVTGTPVDKLHAFSEQVAVSATNAVTTFTFEGAANSSTTFTLAGPDRSYQVEVIAGTGAVRVSEL